MFLAHVFRMMYKVEYVVCFAEGKEGIKVGKEAGQVRKIGIDWIHIKETISPLDRVNELKLKNFLNR